MYKKKVVINEEQDYLDLVQRAILCDKAGQKAEIHIKFIHGENQLIVLFYSENTFKKEVDELASWIEEHYNNP